MLSPEELAERAAENAAKIAQVLAEQAALIDGYNSLTAQIESGLDSLLAKIGELDSLNRQMYNLPTAIAQIVERAVEVKFLKIPNLRDSVQSARKMLQRD